MRSTFTCLGLAALLLLAGCTKRRECTDALERINGAVARLQKAAALEAPKSGEEAAEQSAALAKTVHAEVGNLKALEITTDELKARVLAYVAMVELMAVATQDLADASKRNVSAQHQVASAREQTSAALKVLQAACAEAAASCLKLRDVVLAFPESEDSRALVSALGAYVVRLREAKPDDQKLSEGVEALAKAIDAISTALKDAHSAEDKMRAGAKAIATAIEPEAGLVKEINEICGSAL